MFMISILNSFSGRLVRSVSKDPLLGVVWTVLDWTKFFGLFMVIAVAVGRLWVCQLGEESPFLLAGFLALLRCLCRLHVLLVQPRS